LYDKKRKLAVATGNNFYFTVYEHPETLQRKFDVVSFYDAVQLITNGMNPFKTENGYKYESEGYRLIFSITHNDLVYVPLNEKDTSNIDWSKKRELSKKIYRVVKFDLNKRIFFQPHNFSKEI